MVRTDGRSEDWGMSPVATAPAPRPLSDRALQRWLDPTELERRLEAHLLIARKITR